MNTSTLAVALLAMFAVGGVVYALLYPTLSGEKRAEKRRKEFAGPSAARGIDLRPVAAHRIRKSVGGERTFSEDIGSGAALRNTLETIIDIVWERVEAAQARGRTVTLKLKFTDFQIMTRATSQPDYVGGFVVTAGLEENLEKRS